MKSQIWMGLLSVLAFLHSGCANISQAASLAPTTEPLAVDLESGRCQSGIRANSVLTYDKNGLDFWS
ncbi:MAG TPA: hypothetical protein VFQ23_04910 [Anaerolineales bacterium]|nr:hypothetical protein [Anaerolineales bacterium]